MLLNDTIKYKILLRRLEYDSEHTRGSRTLKWCGQNLRGLRADTYESIIYYFFLVKILIIAESFPGSQCQRDMREYSVYTGPAVIVMHWPHTCWLLSLRLQSKVLSIELNVYLFLDAKEEPRPSSPFNRIAVVVAFGCRWFFIPIGPFVRLESFVNEKLEFSKMVFSLQEWVCGCVCCIHIIFFLTSINSPILNVFIVCLASLGCPASSNSLVQSLPATSVISSAPPGCWNMPEMNVVRWLSCLSLLFLSWIIFFLRSIFVLYHPFRGVHLHRSNILSHRKHCL